MDEKVERKVGFSSLGVGILQAWGWKGTKT